MEKYIIPTYVEQNGTTFKVYKSENGMKIKQVETGNIYGEAWDLSWVNYNYIETDEPIESEELLDENNPR